METLTTSIAICSTCNESLNVKGECLACLLRGGLNGPVEESVAERDSLVFSDFEIARREDGSFWELGCGAMGVTYRATDKVLHRTVALKVIETPAAAGDSRAVRERFLREARAAAALKHPNVAGIFQFGASPEIDRCYYAMELVEGETLEALVRREGPLKVEPALEMAIQVTRALVAAAAQGLIHCDLKPGNIMLTRGNATSTEPEVKVIDFGLAKAIADAGEEMDLTHGGFVGTPNFASPEQFGRGPVDVRSDIYSLGVTLWYALTGQVPYPGKTIEEIRERQKHTDLPIEQLVERKIPASLTGVLRRTLALDPTQRPASARELIEALESCRRKNSRNFFAELKRRNVYKVAIAYAVVAWLLMQVASQIFPFFEIPNWAVRLVVLLLVIGFPVAVILAWAFELTPEGIKRTENVDVSKSITRKSGRKLDFFIIAVLLLVIAILVFQRLHPNISPAVSSSLEKSIAVLPFENFSEDKAFAFFADGVQDEILTDLAKIADLKVISRTSVMQYKGGLTRNLPEIAQALKVAHVLEGSVQRSANRVRVSAQLIDARNDTHVWAEKYDRELADIFAIQSEIAQKIADQLQAKLSPKEKAAIEERPTKDLAAYDLYLRAKELIYESYVNPFLKEDYFKAVQFLDQALGRDPAFLLAHCRLAYAHDLIYFQDYDHTETRLALAETSVRAAVRLQPDSGETHLAQAIHFYWGYRDYDGARKELAKAERALPNNAQIFLFLGLIDRRQGRWDEAIRNGEHALDLDPRNVDVIGDLGDTYFNLRRYKEAIAMANRALALEPRSAFLRSYPAWVGVEADANIAPLRVTLNTIEAEGQSSAAEVAGTFFQTALRERDPAAAARALANIPSEGYFEYPHAWYEGLLAKL